MVSSTTLLATFVLSVRISNTNIRDPTIFNGLYHIRASLNLTSAESVLAQTCPCTSRRQKQRRSHSPTGSCTKTAWQCPRKKTKDAQYMNDLEPLVLLFVLISISWQLALPSFYLLPFCFFFKFFIPPIATGVCPQQTKPPTTFTSVCPGCSRLAPQYDILLRDPFLRQLRNFTRDEFLSCDTFLLFFIL